MSNGKMIIELSETNTDAKVTLRRNGRVTEKCVSAEDLMSQLAQRHTMSTGIIPSNTRFFKGDRNNYTIAIEAPSKVRNFRLWVPQQSYEQGDRYEPELLQVPFPHCLFVFFVRGRAVEDTKLYALQNKLGTTDDTLYHFPYGNVYDDGRVCWGRARLPEIRSPMDFAGVVATFFDAPFNGDLWERRYVGTPDNVSDFWSLVRHMGGQSHFPVNMLRSSRNQFNSVVGRSRRRY